MPIALLVPNRAGENEFVAEGYGIGRRDGMYNDFVVVRSASDPAHVRGLKEVHKPFSQVASIGAIFATRGD
ncbi:MAG TPA: hypothetical protein VEI98_12630 [Xanthobacteraceae bacterium]|nr:hypothetical protein [Xanthobacteraceae bacterium]